jgi:hypothetical protein
MLASNTFATKIGGSHSDGNGNPLAGASSGRDVRGIYQLSDVEAGARLIR